MNSLFLYFLLFLLINITQCTLACHEQERRALLDFKFSLEDPANRLSSWLDDNKYRNCCDWHGVPEKQGKPNTQDDQGKNETQGPKTKRKYTKKNTEYWENKKARTNILEVPLQPKNNELLTEEGSDMTVNEVTAPASGNMVEQPMTLNEEEIRATDESRKIIDFTVDYLDEEPIHDVTIYDVEATVNNQEEEEEEEEEEEDEDFFAEDKLEADEDAWQLQRWREPRPQEWSLPNPWYVSQLQESMQFYIEGTQNVSADGHCGFHTIGFQLGRSCLDYQLVRNNMHAEAFNHKTFYEKVLGSEERYTNMLKRLRFDDGDVMDTSKWFKMPEDGLVAAQTFRSVLIWLSKGFCATFFPSRHGPIKGKKHRVIVMAFVNGDHFVPMKLKLGAPIPPPCNMWVENAYEDAKVWPKKYEEKMKTYKKRTNFKETDPENPVVVI